MMRRLEIRLCWFDLVLFSYLLPNIFSRHNSNNVFAVAAAFNMHIPTTIGCNNPSLQQHRRSSSLLLHATSSRNLKADQASRFSKDDEDTETEKKTITRTTKKKISPTSKTTRSSTSSATTAVEKLRRARLAALRAKRKQQEEQNSKKQSKKSTVSSSPPPLISLSDLNQAIDEQLSLNRRVDSQVFVNGIVRHYERKSITSLLTHNNQQSSPPQQKQLSSTHTIAIIFGKKLQDDQVSVEYAARIQCLVEYLMSTRDNENTVDVICFCGSTPTTPSSSSKSGSSSTTQQQHHPTIHPVDAGYTYFRHLCASQNISLQNIDFLLDRKSVTEKQHFARVMHYLHHHHIMEWLATSTDIMEPGFHSLTGERRKQPRKRIQLLFTLCSSEYHLCTMNDVHARSPNQSYLKPLLLQQPSTESSSSSSYNDDDDDDEEDSNISSPSINNGVIQTSWQYEYATYPFIYANQEDTTAFIGRCFLLSQELTPLLLNLRGVVEDKEFFQRDNYLALASIRRSLVTYLEKLYEAQPFLRDELRDVGAQEQDMNIVLEGAVLSLGRCMDLVRPGGMLLGSVSKQDYTKALRLLEHAIFQIQHYCDPDKPLDPSEWGKLRTSLGLRNNSNKSEEVHPEIAAEQASTMEAMQELAESMTKEEGEANDAASAGAVSKTKRKIRPSKQEKSSS